MPDTGALEGSGSPCYEAQSGSPPTVSLWVSIRSVGVLGLGILESLEGTKVLRLGDSGQPS